MEIKKYFKQAIKEDASDLHLVGEESPILRLEGELKHIEDKINTINRVMYTIGVMVLGQLLWVITRSLM